MIKAIETRYAGCRFRSRLEARWAVFFDRLNIPWEYEPEGYLVGPDQVPYLPDFLIYPNTPHSFWLEIKATAPTEAEIAKARGLAEGTGLTTYIYFRQPEVPAPDLSHIKTFDQYAPHDLVRHQFWDEEFGWISYEIYEYRAPGWVLASQPTALRFDRGQKRDSQKGQWWWTECPHCDLVVIKRHGQIGFCPSFDGQPESFFEEMGELYPRFAHHTPRLLSAYTAARSARFEHGESGA